MLQIATSVPLIQHCTKSGSYWLLYCVCVCVCVCARARVRACVCACDNCYSATALAVSPRLVFDARAVNVVFVVDKVAL